MISREIVTVPGAMPLIGTAPGNHLYLRSARAVEVRRLTESADLKLLDAFDRGGHHARGHRAGLGPGETGEVLNIPDGVTGHIVRIVAAIYGESVLVHIAAGNVASRRHARRQSQQ